MQLPPPPTNEPEVYATRSQSFWENDRRIKQYLLNTEPIYATLYKLRQAVSLIRSSSLILRLTLAAGLGAQGWR
jgi:hypothetical protein